MDRLVRRTPVTVAIGMRCGKTAPARSHVGATVRGHALRDLPASNSDEACAHRYIH